MIEFPSSSTVPIVKQTILDALEGLTGTDGRTPVQLGYSRPPNLQRESIYFVGATGRHRFAAIRGGRKTRDETYTLRLQIDTAVPGRSAQDAEARAFRILQSVEDAIAEDPQLGIAPTLEKAEITDWIAGPDPNGEGWDGLITLSIDCQARLV